MALSSLPFKHRKYTLPIRKFVRSVVLFDWSYDRLYGKVTRMMKTTRKTVNASEFKAKCLKFLDHLSPEGMVITKRGRPVARILPVTAATNAETIGSMKGKIIIKGDLFSTGVKWHAQS